MIGGTPIVRLPIHCLVSPCIPGVLAKGGLFMSFSVVLEPFPELGLVFVELLELFLVCCC